MPSGARYWTVVGDDLEVVGVADRFLREERFGRDRAELTTKAHAGAVVLYLRWCTHTGRDWRIAAADFGLFATWLAYAPADESDPAVTPGVAVRQPRRINRVLSGVRTFLTSAVTDGEVPGWVLGRLYEIADQRDLPVQARTEDAGLVFRMAARHRLREPYREVDRATDDEIVALFRACRSARDRLIILLLARVGLRRGEMVGLRRQDMHLLADSRVLGCAVAGSHLHVVRRDNVNGAWAKSRRSRAMPTDFLVVDAVDHYSYERDACAPAADCDFLLVNLRRGEVGAPMRPDAINELLEALSLRADLLRMITPHMLRHAFASDVADAGGGLDEIQALLGHASPYSASPYLHTSSGRLRAAVERAGSPRLTEAAR
jgi:integrase